MDLPTRAPDFEEGVSRVCLVVIFNHRFEANLEKLDKIYAPRFRHVRYLMPFYRGSRADVFAVQYSSFQFNGFVLEVWRRLRDEGFTDFVFVADDMLLNPRLHEGNICAELGLKTIPGSAYITRAASVGTVTCRWPDLPRSLIRFVGKTGVNWEQELPAFDEARKILESRGRPYVRFGWHNVLCRMNGRTFFELLAYLALFLKARKSRPWMKLADPPYPLLVAYSDFFVVPATAMEEFSRLCGVFAAMALFVEVALPTALALSAPIVCEGDTPWKALQAMQPVHEREGFARTHNYEYARAVAAMGEHELYIHPIKLSQWKF